LTRQSRHSGLAREASAGQAFTSGRFAASQETGIPAFAGMTERKIIGAFARSSIFIEKEKEEWVS
jgi:hypothetical protein